MVPAYSDKVPRVSSYSGYCLALRSFAYGAFTLSGRSFQDLSATSLHRSCSPNPRCKHLVWALPRSLAATYGITVVFSSSGYLDVSVHRVSLRCTMDLCSGDTGLPCRVSPFRHPRIKVYLPLPAAFRSLSRLSSALSAKASALRPI